MTYHTTFLFIVVFSDLVAVSLIVPLIGAQLRSLGASHLVVGFMGSLYAALQLISSPVVGSWSDIHGRRLILLFTMVVCSMCYVIWGITSSVVVSAVLRLILGAFKHTQTLCKALVADSIPYSEHSKVFGKLNAVSGMGFVIGPIIGGHLAELEKGFFYICCLVAVVFWINTGLVYFCVPETIHLSETHINGAHNTGNLSIKNQMNKIFLLLNSIDWISFWDLFTFKFLLAFSLAIFHSNYVLYVQEYFNMGLKWVGYTISLQGMIGAVSSILIGYLQKLYKNDPFFNLQLFHGFVGLAASYCLLAFSPSLKVFIIGLIPLSASGALLRVVGMDILLQRVDADKRGSLVGSSNSISSVARLVAPISGGVVVSIFGLKGMFVLAELVSVGGVVLSYALCKGYLKSQK